MKVLDVAIIIGIGISKTISISNIIKITANRKNRVENGIRAVLIGSNPHSNGDVFSRSACERILIIEANNRRSVGMITHVKDEIKNIFI
jgi:hypothetical protein